MKCCKLLSALARCFWSTLWTFSKDRMFPLGVLHSSIVLWCYASCILQETRCITFNFLPNVNFLQSAPHIDLQWLISSRAARMLRNRNHHLGQTQCDRSKSGPNLNETSAQRILATPFSHQITRIIGLTVSALLVVICPLKILISHT